MERRRQQQQRIKQQQRFCVSQQDLTQAITRMKPIDNRSQRDLLHLSSSSSCSSSIETLTKLSVSQLIKEFEARSITTITPYASAQEILPNIINDAVVNGAESNCYHMSVQTMKIKVNESNNSVCSLISRLIDDCNQTVTVTNHQQQQQLTEDKKEQETTTKTTEKKEEEENQEQQQHQQTSLPDNDRHKRDLPSSTSASFHSIENCSCSSSTTNMLTRSTDIDAAAAATAARHDAHFNDLLAKEAQLNTALADLISISNDGDVSSSITSSSRSLIPNQHRSRNSNPTSKDNSLSASIALLNNLLEVFDVDDDNLDKKKQNAEKIPTDEHLKPINMFCLMLSDNLCANCHQSFAINEQIVNAAGQIWHTHCFVCAQCFQPFENGIYFEHEDRKYCERDFQMLFAPCCAECKQPIVGRVIRALQKCFHPDCFRCQSCHIPLLETGFSKHNNRALCRECHANEKSKNSLSSNSTQQICSKCQQMIIDNRCLKYKGEFCHAYHFQCTTCRNELDEFAREVRGSLYCVTCYNELDLPVCAACRRLIDDRVVSALGKQWHVEHFCCARCAQPFCGSRHFENKGLAYCETDYHLLFGSTCFVCNSVITEGAYTACNKKYCADHFACSICEIKMTEKSKFFDVDATPVCKQCFGKFPSDIRKSLQQHQKKKPTSCIFETTMKKSE